MRHFIGVIAKFVQGFYKDESHGRIFRGFRFRIQAYFKVSNSGGVIWQVSASVLDSRTVSGFGAL
jgi:hypothetical protein